MGKLNVLDGSQARNLGSSVTLPDSGVMLTLRAMMLSLGELLVSSFTVCNKDFGVILDFGVVLTVWAMTLSLGVLLANGKASSTHVER